LKKNEINNNNKRRFNASFFLCALLIISLVSFKLYNDVQLNEFTTKSVQIKKELETLHSEETRLNVLLEKRTDLREIERRAKEELGLKKIERYQIEYISLPTEDKFQSIAQKEDSGILNALSRGFSIILEFLS